jgi:uncharacterized protein YkwD
MAIGAAKAARSALLAGFALALLVWGASVSTPAASASACDRFGKSDPSKLRSDDARRAIVCLLNQRRDRAGLPDLRPDNRLDRAAQQHNRRMDGTGCFDHACAGESDLGRRLERVGYLGGGLTRWVYGENLAWGADWRGSPAAIVAAWMDSPPHRANILNRSFREVGIGFDTGTPGGDNAPGGIYTVDFGLRVD